ncbi:MAG: MBL fold metallo-hydrolase [Lachnospiraceae bacterium]|nr:MBL fold metallo-hydrolase [Lachnospiraceae bacterium]
MSYSTGIAIYNCGKFSEKKKGDNAIIDCGNNDYMMIDCGPKDSASSYLTQILRRCNRKTSGEYKGKIYIRALVLSHNHSDHVGGLDTLLKSNDLYIQRVFYCRPGSGYNGVCSIISNNSVSGICVEPGHHKTITMNDTVLKIYGPATEAVNAYGSDFDEYDGKQVNNSSMICTVTNTSADKPYRALFLGDLEKSGLGYAIESWGDKIFLQLEIASSLVYNFCKFGHHAQRKSYNYGNGDKNGSKEMDFYNERIKANRYFMTVTRAHLEALDEADEESYTWENYNYIVKKLDTNVRRYIRDETHEDYRVWYVYGNWN